MVTIGIGIGVGVCYLASRLYERKKTKAILNDVLLTQKFQVYTYSKWITYILFALILPSIYCIYLGYSQNDELSLAFGILLVFLFLAEGINSIDLLKLYYCDNGCVINNKYIRYKSMKSLRKKYALPLSKWNLQTFQNEKITINKPVALFIESHGNIQIVHKQD